MKKTLLLLTAVVGLLCHQAEAQTITVSGSSHTVNPGDVFNVTISLSVSAALPSNVTALNLLLATPTSGPNSGVGLFTVRFLQGGPDFPNRIGGSGATSTFDTPTSSGPNAGFTVSTPSNDLGASANQGGGVTAPFENVVVVFLEFTVSPSAAAGTSYDFRATLGFPDDPNGSFINIASGSPDTRAVTDAPIFNVAVVPEPSTWALIAVGGIASVGMTMFRRRKS